MKDFMLRHFAKERKKGWDSFCEIGSNVITMNAIDFAVTESKNQHVCPWWLGYFLINPLRRYRHNTDQILMPFITPGMRILDFGCAMGYFSLPMARMTGETGKVYCVDVQERMLARLEKRASKEGLMHNIETRLVGQEDVVAGLNGEIDFALLFAVVHEVPNPEDLFRMLANLVRPAGRILFAEPKGHVSEPAFRHSVALAEQAGFVAERTKRISGTRAIVLRKKIQ
jgi:2-polyprenyl-3-methyl-5-hydroxy-6-metoxy-1,4-benzoquinol methylase